MVDIQKEQYYEKFVRDNLLASDIYLALAEEASELSQAAAKQARILIGNNPSPVSREDAEQNVLEELADVYVCANVLYGGAKDNYVSDVMETKLSRWVSGLLDGTECETKPRCTGWVDALNERVYVGDTLYGNKDNKQWKVVGTTPEFDPYVLHVEDKQGTTKNVIPRWMAHSPWNFDTPVTVFDGAVLPNDTCYVFGEFSPVTLVSYNKGVACVKHDFSSSCKVVPVSSLSSRYWDSYDKVVADIVKYKENPKTYCERFRLTSKLEPTDKLTVTTRMQHHLGERLQRL